KAKKNLQFAEEAVVWTHRPATLSEFWNNEVRWRRAHLQSLVSGFRHNFSSLEAVLKTGRLYVVVLALSLGFAIALVSALIGEAQLAISIFVALALVMIVVSGRRAALAGEIASFTGNWRWLLYLWTPALLLLVSFFASGWAFLTLNRRTIHFKGPR
ncbi:MAG TPA: hypothetical protein VFM05_01060, partial [Candidatus Saccharimonadales bacterium]|nr:hypothetical protein [Candidatus Saccharimonadales bacterium]